MGFLRPFQVFRGVVFWVLAVSVLTATVPEAAAQTASDTGAGGRPVQDMPLVQFAQEHGFKLLWEPYRRVAELRRGGERMRISPRWTWIVRNRNRILYRGKVLENRRGTLTLLAPAAQALLRGGGGEGGELDRSEGRPETGPPDSRGVLEEAHPRIKTIIIDPGHGGHDPGTVHTWETESGNNVTMQEKEIVLQVSRDIAARLQERFPDREILMTRREDSYPTLQDRVDLANQVELSEAETMLFLSIHVNASFNKKARGYEVWYLPPEVRRTVLPDEQSQGKPQKVIPVLNRMLEEEYSRQSRRLASEILGELDHRVGEQTENRGMKEESWYVVRHARMPAVLLELGFITHEEEAALLRKDAYLKKLASAVYNGIVRYVEGAEY